MAARRDFQLPLSILRIAAAAVLTIVILAALVQAEDPPFGPQRGVLLLRNGELIEGEITLAGDRYDVVVPSGQIRIRRGDVQFFGHSTQECYEQRKTLVSIDKVHDHLDLADWCLRHHLYDQAALALADAVATDCNHPKIALLERRLKLELEQQAPTQPSAKASEADLPSLRDLDRLTQGLPLGAVETFTATIQPMLLNHCSTAGCHGPQGTETLRLVRVATGKAQSRRATQRNLYAVLSAIDQDNPAESRLLSAPTRAHGRAKSAVFTTREALQYRQLVEWVYTVSNQTAPHSESAALSDPHVSRSAVRRRTAQMAGRTANKSAEPGTVRPGVSHLANPATAPARSGDEAQSEKAAAEDSAGKASDKAQPAAETDAFDPQAFNDRYLKGPAD